MGQLGWLTWNLIRWNEDGQPSQSDENKGRYVGLHEMERHFPTKHDSHDHSWIGQIVIIRRVVVAQFHLKVKLRQTDISIDVVAYSLTIYCNNMYVNIKL